MTKMNKSDYFIYGYGTESPYGEKPISHVLSELHSHIEDVFDKISDQSTAFSEEEVNGFLKNNQFEAELYTGSENGEIKKDKMVLVISIKHEIVFDAPLEDIIMEFAEERPTFMKQYLESLLKKIGETKSPTIVEEQIVGGL